MADADQKLTVLRLMAWLSPAFPVGAFSYSHGLESAAHDGLISGGDGLHDWLSALIEHGSLWNDAVLAAEAMRCASAGEDLAPVAELAEALAGSAERHLETMSQGRAFADAAENWRGESLAGLPRECPYCVAFGVTAGQAAIEPDEALAAFLQAVTSGLVQAAIRLSLIGQTDAVRIMARLEPVIASVADRAVNSSLDDLGSGTIRSEIASMRHETQYSRLFRS